MASIRYAQARYSTLLFEPIEKISSDIDPIDLIENCIKERQIKDFNEVDLRGWVAFQFDVKKSRLIHDPLSVGRIDNGLVSTHVSFIPKPLPPEISDLIKSEDIPPEIKNYIAKMTRKQILDDFIFVKHGKKLKTIIPKDDPDKLVKYILIPTLGEEFEITSDTEVQITADMLQWLVWKVKKRQDGDLGKMRITMVDIYRSIERMGRHRDMTVDRVDVENETFAQLSVGLRDECNEIKLNISYNGRDYPFYLYIGGVFYPIWHEFESMGTENPTLEKIMDVLTISLDIIPHIISEYRKDAVWKTERDRIYQQELSDGKNKLP